MASTSGVSAPAVAAVPASVNTNAPATTASPLDERDTPCALPVHVFWYPEHVADSHPQVAERCAFRRHEMAVALALPAAQHHERQRVGAVHVGVAHAAAVEHHRVV